MLGIVHIVDDDASFRTAIERRLKKAGYEVATYPSAQHLLDRLPNESGPGCLLLDVRIPGLSGPELQSRLGELGSTLPIVFLTGYTDVPTTVQAIKAGADDFLTKPVKPDQLLRSIQRAISRHEATRSIRMELDTIRAHFAARPTRRSLTHWARPNAQSRLIATGLWRRCKSNRSPNLSPWPNERASWTVCQVADRRAEQSINSSCFPIVPWDNRKADARSVSNLTDVIPTNTDVFGYLSFIGRASYNGNVFLSRIAN